MEGLEASLGGEECHFGYLQMCLDRRCLSDGTMGMVGSYFLLKRQNLAKTFVFVLNFASGLLVVQFFMLLRLPGQTTKLSSF